MKILIIKLGALGDIIVSTPVINGILEHHKDDTVYLLTTPAFHGVFSNLPSLTIKSLPRTGLINTFRQVCWIRKQGFDRIYDLQSNDRTAILCALSGCKFCAGNHPRFYYHKHPVDAYTGQCHPFERLNQIIMATGLPTVEPKPALIIPLESRGKVRDWLSQHEVKDGKYVVMHAGSSPGHLRKRWPYFPELASYIAAAGYTIIWVGTDDERGLNKTLVQISGIDATNQFSIPELVALGRCAAFAVTNDSAPMHILSCSGIPVFGLFGPTNPRHSHALGQQQHVICAQQYPLGYATNFTPEDIGKISVTDVLNRLRNDRLLK